MDTQPSKKQIEANRRNASKSSGPKTAEGKARSRGNGLRHGFSAEVVVPEGDRAAVEAVMARWKRDAGPDNVVEEHLIRRAAVGSITLERLDEVRDSTRRETAREAVRRWERTQQHRARRKAQDLERDPSNTLMDLEATAFGCDWLIRQWQALDAPLRVGRAWDQRTLARAQRLLGLPEAVPGPDAEPAVRILWRLAGAAAPTTVTMIPKVEGEPDLPVHPAEARLALRGFIAAQVNRLIELRDDSWEFTEGPERDAVIARAVAADTSPEGQLRHRYARDADRSASGAIRLYLNIRDRRRREFLAIAKEAGRCDIPRVCVGGGWWREVDSDPTPPGFSRDAFPQADLATSPGGDLPSPGPEPIPTPPAAPPRSPDRPASDRSEPTTPEAGRRTEANSPPEDSAEDRRNPHDGKPLRNVGPGSPINDPRRTEPRPGPDQPSRFPSDRLG